MEEGMPRVSEIGPDSLADDVVPSFDESDMLFRDYAIQVTEKVRHMREGIFKDVQKFSQNCRFPI